MVGRIAALLFAPLVLAGALLFEAATEILGGALRDLRGQPPGAALALGLAGGFGAASLVAIGPGVARRRLAPWAAALPAALAGAAGYLAGAAWILVPAWGGPERGLGDRAAALAGALAAAAGPFSLGLAMAGALLAAASFTLALRAWKPDEAGRRSGAGAAAAAALGAFVLFVLAFGARGLRLFDGDLEGYAASVVANESAKVLRIVGRAAGGLALGIAAIAAATLPAGPTRHARRALLIGALAAIAPALLVYGHGARALARIGALSRDEQRLVDFPGVPVIDDALPGGALVIDLVRALPDLPLERPAHIALEAPAGAPRGEPGRRWAPGRPTRFDALRAARYEAVISGPYLIDRAALDLPGAGARVALEALPLRPASVVPPGASGKVLEIDTTRPDRFTLRWIQGSTLVAARDVPRAPEPAPGDRVAYPGLAIVIGDEWRQHGWHRDPSDRRSDVAVIRALPGTPLREARAVAGAALATRRVYEYPYRKDERPVFELWIAEPRPEKKRTADDEVEPLDAAAGAGRGAPPAEAAATLRRALARCRASTCSAPVHARLWLHLGEALAAAGRADDATDAFFMARTLEPGVALAPGAGAEGAAAFEGARELPLPRVEAGDLRSSGRIPPERVRAIVAGIHGPVRACYAEALRGRPDLAGDVKLHFVVGRDGAVTQARSARDEPPHPVLPCALRALEALSFPPPEAGIVGVDYTLVLSPPR